MNFAVQYRPRNRCRLKGRKARQVFRLPCRGLAPVDDVLCAASVVRQQRGAAVPGLYLYELSSRGVEIPYTPCRLDSLFRALFFSKSNIGRSAMRMLWLFGVATVLFVSMPTSQADARWVCRASSSTGSWGMGWHNSSRSYARGRALLECAARTPRNRTCYIRSCRRR